MTREVHEFRNNYSDSHEISPSELLGFLCAWLKNHILASDMEFGRFLKTLPTAKEKSNPS